MRRRETDVPQPSADHVDLDAGFEQVHGGGVPEDVGRDPGRCGATLQPVKGRRVPSHDLVDPISRERATLLRAEDRCVGRAARTLLLEVELEHVGGFGPKRTEPPLVALAVEPHPERWIEVDVLDPQICDLLDPGTSVVQEQHQHAVAECMAPALRKIRKELVDLAPFHEASRRRGCSLHRDPGHALRRHDRLRDSRGEEVEEGVQDSQALIARRRPVASFVFEVPQEVDDAIKRQIIHRQPSDLTSGVFGDEAEEKSQPVAVATNRRRPHAFDDR